jgi:hypothetical protein
MQTISIEQNGKGQVANIAAAVNSAVKRSRLLPAGAGQRSQPAIMAIPAPIEPAIVTDESEATDELKTRFQGALIASCKSEASLSDVVVELIAYDVTRETAIEWGVEAGLSASYVQSTVSRLYIALTGERKKKVGGGRKANKGAAGFAERAMKACDDDTDKALALLLAARRTLEGWIKKGTVEKELAKIRTAKSE